MAAERSTETIRSEIMSLIEEYYAVAHGRKPFSRDSSPVPVSGRVYDAHDMMSLVDSALDFWLTTGRFNEAFQTRLAKRIGVRYATTVNSGSSANLVAFSALTSPLLGERQIQPGSEVITAATGFPTTVNPAMLWGMVPVFVDVDIPTYNIVPDLVEEAITPKTRAIMVAHTLGNPFDAARLAEIARRHGLFLIEDCCDALGATFNGRHVGTFGDIGTLSFYPAHHITMGEGGATFTWNPTLKRAMEAFRDWGRDCYCEPGNDNTCNRRFDWQLGELPYGYDHKYIYSHLGFNLKITDMQAAVGLAQLDHLDDFIAARRRNFSTFCARVSPSWRSSSCCPRRRREASRRGSASRSRCAPAFPSPAIVFVRHLNDKRIGTRLLFGGNLVRQPYMKGRNFRIHGELKNGDRIMHDTFWIGVYPGLDNDAIAYVIDTMIDFCRATVPA